MIDAHSKNAYSVECEAQHKAYIPMGMIAVALADGITKPSPQKHS